MISGVTMTAYVTILACVDLSRQVILDSTVDVLAAVSRQSFEVMPTD